MGLGRAECVLAKVFCCFEVFPLGRVRSLEVFDESLTDSGEAVLGRHPKERCEDGELWNLVPWREPSQQSTTIHGIYIEGKETHPGV